MACRGVFFALTADQAETVLAATDDDALMVVIEAIENAWDLDNLAQCDKAWDAMHRALTDGRLEWGNGPYPLNQVVLGSRSLHRGDDYFVSFVPPDVVRDVAPALQALSKAWFDERYRTVVPRNYALEYGEDDQEYTWSWFEDVRALFVKAAERGRAVIFTVDQ